MRRLTISILLAPLTVLAVVVTACGSDGASTSPAGTTATTPAVSTDPLVGSWTLTGYSRDGEIQAAAASPAGIDLAADGTFAGTTGCNEIAGTWAGDAGGWFTITPGPMTLRGCVDPFVQAQEAALTSGMPEVAGAELTTDSLTMTDASGAVLFTWARASDQLTGTYRVTGINNGNDAVVGSAATEAATITFSEDGTVSGNTGCNSFSGSYTVDGDTLEIDSDVASTLMACAEDAQQVEQQFLDALSQVATWERTGDVVTLRDPAGSTQLTLVAES